MKWGELAGQLRRGTRSAWPQKSNVYLIASKLRAPVGVEVIVFGQALELQIGGQRQVASLHILPAAAEGAAAAVGQRRAAGWLAELAPLQS